MNEGLRTRARRLAAAARDLQAAGGRAPLNAPFSLAFLSDRKRVAHPDLVVRALPAGAAIIYRDYDDPRREATGAMLREIAASRGVLFLVGADVMLARRLHADGVHLRTEDARARGVLADARGGSGPRLIVSAACHGARDLANAAAIGADIALLSPVFATPTHPGARPLGVGEFKRLAAGAATPVLALGGVDATNAALLAGARVAGIAAIGAFYG